MDPENPTPPQETTTPEESSSQTSPEQSKTEDRLEFEEPNFSELVGITESEEEEQPQEQEEETPAVAASTSEEEGGEPEAPQAPVSTEQPAPKATEEPTKEATPEPETPAVKVPTKEELVEQYEQFRKDSLPALEKLYEMDDETAAAFNENPIEVLPKIAAKLHYESMMSAYNGMMAALPHAVMQVMQAVQKTNEAADQFFQEWPELKDEKLQKVVSASIRSFRQSNPQADLKKVIAGAGMLAAMQAGLDLKPVSMRAAQPPPTPSVRRLPPKPVAPGGSVPTPPSRSTPKEENIFADLAEAFTNQLNR